MGNQQSHSSDEEERERSYTYHEDVLRSAQQLTADSTVYESDHDEYFSAEEGDSDRSITPTRTRPESSSGEDFSGDSSGGGENDDQGEMEDSPSPQRAMASRSDGPASFISPSGRLLRSTRTSGGLNNASRLEEHDSIGPELETSRWHLNDSSMMLSRSTVGSQRSTQQSRNPSLSLTNTQSRRISNSPFIPIRSQPHSFNVSRGGSSFHSPSKRKQSQSPRASNEGVPPSKRYSKETSPFKRGVGYLDSSDSDDDVEADPRMGRRPHGSRSPKRLKASQSIPSPGSKRSPEVKIDVLVRGERYASDLNPKRRRVIDKQALHSAIASSPKRPNSTEVTEWQGDMKRLRGRDISGGHAGEQEVQENISHFPCGNSAFCDVERKTSRVGVIRPHVDAGDPVCVFEGENHPPKTSKMGSNGVKNSLGKLIPVRGQVDVTEKVTYEGERKGTERDEVSPPLSNIAENLRDKAAIFESPSHWHRKRKSNTDASPEPQLNLKTSSSGDPPAINPLANVVLTPPSAESFFSRSQGQISHGTSLKTPDSETKRKKPTAAERFKNFWSQGTNFKSIFANKPKLTPARQTTESSNVAQGSSSSSLSPSAYDNSSMFSDTSHMHFSSSPADSLGFQSRPSASNSSPSVNIGSVSPIFSSLPSKSPSDSQVDKASHRYSSILSMSAKAQKKESPHQNVYHSRMPTRTSPRFQHSTTKLASPPSNLPSSSAEIEMLPPISQYQVLHFRLADTLEISVGMGDIADSATAGIVNWTDGALTHGVTECSQRIAARAGALMRAGCADYLANKGSLLEPPDVLTTPAGGRFPKSVEALLHVASPQLVTPCRRGSPGSRGPSTMPARLLEVYANCLRFADERLGLQSLSLPLIGEDLFTPEVSIKAFFDSVLVFLTETRARSADDSSSTNAFDLASIRLIISDASTTDLAAELINGNLHRLATASIEVMARDTVSSYYSDSSPERKQNQPDSIERASSGRPRLKRPKL